MSLACRMSGSEGFLPVLLEVFFPSSVSTSQMLEPVRKNVMFQIHSMVLQYPNLVFNVHRFEDVVTEENKTMSNHLMFKNMEEVLLPS